MSVYIPMWLLYPLVGATRAYAAVCFIAVLCMALGEVPREMREIQRVAALFASMFAWFAILNVWVS